jgi:hypothetical protein
MIESPCNNLRLLKRMVFSKSLRLSNVTDGHCAASVFRAIRNDGMYVPDRTTSHARSHNT